jgi:hypothetical protein
MGQAAFHPDFEKAVVAALIQDPKFLKESLPVLRPEFFVDQLNASAVKVITATFIRTKAPPSRVGLLTGLVEEQSRTHKVKRPEDQQLLVLKPCEELCDFLFQSLGNIEDVKAKFLDMCRHREMEMSLLESVQKLESG